MPFERMKSRVQRVALFSGNYNYVMDGPVRALNKLVAHLEQQGIDVLVFAPTVKKPAFQHVGTLVSVPSIPFPGRSEYRVGLGLTPNIRRKLAKFKPDIVHLAAPDLLGLSALKWANKNGIPAVSSFHTRFDTYPRYYGMDWLEDHLTQYMRNFYHRCEHVYVPSQSMIDVLTNQKMSPNLRLWTRGVDMDLFAPDRRDMAWRRSLGIDDDEIVVAFVGRLVLEKGLGKFADALDVLKSRCTKVRPLIVGAGPERENFQDRLPHAVFTGFLDGEALARAYASADIFFNASITETFGNVTLEAMASGTPAVCADATGSRTLVDHGRSGYLVDYDDVEGFADCMERLISHSDLRASFAAVGLQRAAGYSWHSVLSALHQQYEDAYREYSPQRMATLASTRFGRTFDMLAQG